MKIQIVYLEGEKPYRRYFYDGDCLVPVDNPKEGKYCPDIEPVYSTNPFEDYTGKYIHLKDLHPLGVPSWELSIPYVFEGEAYIRPGHVGVKVHHYMPHFRRAIPGERTVINGSLLVVNQQGHWEFKGKEELNLMYRIMHHPKKEVWGGEMTGIDSWGNPVERTYGNPDFPEGGQWIGDGRVTLMPDGYYYWSVGGNGYTICRIHKDKV